MSKLTFINENDRRTAEWGARRGLKMLDTPYGNAESPRALLEKGEFESQLRELERKTGSLMTFFDHARYFVLPPARKKAGVMHTSMYRGNLASRYGGDDETFASEVQEIAGSFALRVRIGSEDDVTYASVAAGPPTVPVVWWNPARVDLEQVEQPLRG